MITTQTTLDFVVTMIFVYVPNYIITDLLSEFKFYITALCLIVKFTKKNMRKTYIQFQ